ncbi:FAD/NAD(P)-binding protein [Sphingomonas abietis]|uniref:FAD/NAD(P)-binding protein n=1 Tax=Sphingomonas abietis TaxID=3012344 RepID=A0ABY7NTE9_9SPHN|nr:FAD/NAD(P)-binding protein [Sphingomonas abietis]WBO23716.1 FAD/NAD(P)-binding protein [Sphingomonas abietis]
MTGRHVAIVGGGFTGTLLAINILRHGGPSVTIIERRPQTGRGAAYSTIHPEHLLNVRAGNMSALPDDPDHFVRWLDARALQPSSGFVPRRIYGDYLGELLAEAVAQHGDRLRLVQGQVVDVDGAGAAMNLRLDDGRRIAADVVALASGNLLPAAPHGLDPATLSPGCYVPDPWCIDIASDLAPDDNMVVLGTGLTMVDVALLMDARGFEGRILALSRRGLAPREHVHGGVPGGRSERPRPTAIAATRALRARSREVDWRVAVDDLRPFTQSLWRAMALPERQRFLRHLRPWWDVHRHRIAPHVAERLQRMQREGRLEIVAGRLVSATPTAAGVEVRYRPRGGDDIRTLTARRLVNGTGPQGDLATTSDPLLAALHRRGMLRPDPLHIGIDVDQDSRAIDTAGGASDSLLVLGPMTRGAFWEIIAVPDIRRQVWSVARRLANAQWVEGDGL